MTVYFWENDWFFWGLGFVLALSGLIRLAQKRREQLVELLRTYVEKNQASKNQVSKTQEKDQPTP